MRLIITALLCLFSLQLAGQNCQLFLEEGKKLKYEACMIAEQRQGYYQYSKEYQQALDRAIAHDPTYSYAYRHKSTAYLKSGDFLTWLRLMNKAVELAPMDNLAYRGWCRYQFFRDYRGAIADIEKLDELNKYDIGYSQNGQYHLNIAKAICYYKLGEIEKAFEIILDQLETPNYLPGPFDYLHLGAMYIETGQVEAARKVLELQAEQNPIAESFYYLAQAHKLLSNKGKYQELLTEAEKQYKLGMRMFDPYTHPPHKIYLAQIQSELKSAGQ